MTVASGNRAPLFFTEQFRTKCFIIGNRIRWLQPNEYKEEKNILQPRIRYRDELMDGCETHAPDIDSHAEVYRTINR